MRRGNALLGLLVVAPAKKDRVTQEALVGPLREAHLANQFRFNPGRVLLRYGRNLLARRSFALLLLQMLPDSGEILVGEPAAGAAGIGQLTVHILRQMEGTESRTGPLGRSESDHDEIV